MTRDSRPRAGRPWIGPVDPATVAAVGCAVGVIGVVGVLARVALPEHLAISWAMIAIGATATTTAVWWQRGRRRRELTRSVATRVPSASQIPNLLDWALAPRPPLELGRGSASSALPASTSASTEVSDRLAR